jgi:hypothetical protein
MAMGDTGVNFTDRSVALAMRDAIAGVAARYTVALILRSGTELGSGILVADGDTLFIATARHVAEEFPPGDVYCIPKPHGPVTILPRDEVLRRARVGIKPTASFALRFTRRVASTDGSDVALLRIGERPPEFNEMDFYQLNRGRSDSLPHTSVAVYGYATELTINGVALPRVVTGILGTVPDAEFDPARDLIVTYEDPDPMSAAGMSGGGVWLPSRLPSQPSEGLWNPGDMMLVGIQVRQFPESRAAGRPLRATRIERVQALI